MRLHLGNAYVANKYICVLIDLFGIDLCYNFAQRVKVHRNTAFAAEKCEVNATVLKGSCGFPTGCDLFLPSRLLEELDCRKKKLSGNCKTMIHLVILALCAQTHISFFSLC